jgi:hypothetical protein
MGQFEIEETNVETKTGFFVSKKLAILGLAIFASIVTGSVLVTYFAKPNDCESVNGQCQSLACENPSLAQGNQIFD